MEGRVLACTQYKYLCVHIILNGMVIYMINDYYFNLVEGLLVTCPLTVDFIDKCCPTFFLDGSPCPPAINRSNLACLIIEDFIL